jgi:hypothetical protein
MEPIEILSEFQEKGYVFKRCIKSYYSNDCYDCIVIMKKPETFKCNELRTSIVDKNFAKFRSSGLITIAIYDLKLQKFINKLEHILLNGSSFLYATYEVGILTQPDKYEEDISKICASGIHYFLSLEAALGYDRGWVVHLKDGNLHLYDSNGKISKFYG